MDHYNIRISEQQRRIIHEAMCCLIANGFNEELDDYGQPVAKDLMHLFENDPNSASGLLSTTGLNLFIL